MEKICNKVRRLFSKEITPKISYQRVFLFVMNIIYAVIIAIVLFAFFRGGSDEVVQKQRVSQSQLSSVQSKLDSWGDGRWNDWQAGVSSDGELLIRVYADNSSNDVAISSYCNVIKGVSSGAGVEEGSRSLFVYQGGVLKKSCI